MRKAFSLLELLVAVALAGAMAVFTFNVIDINTITKDATKAKLQSDLNLVTSAVLQCKELSSMFPIENNGSHAIDTNLTRLDCNTTTTYSLDGGRGYFMPKAATGFTIYQATQNGTEFYISTTAEKDSKYDEILIDLNTTYSTQQYVLTYDTTTAYLKFYISR